MPSPAVCDSVKSTMEMCSSQLEDDIGEIEEQKKKRRQSKQRRL